VPTLGTSRDAAQFGKGEVGNAFSIEWHLKLIEVASPARGRCGKGLNLLTCHRWIESCRCFGS
jgi:hypothetical protein